MNKSQYRDTHSEDTIGNVQNTLCLELLIASNTQSRVFIQSWTIPRKYLWSANFPKAMSQMSAMKM